MGLLITKCLLSPFRTELNACYPGLACLLFIHSSNPCCRPNMCQTTLDISQKFQIQNQVSQEYALSRKTQHGMSDAHDCPKWTVLSWITRPLVKLFDLIIFLSQQCPKALSILSSPEATHMWIFTPVKEFLFSVCLLCARLCSMGWEYSMNTVDKISAFVRFSFCWE